MERAYEKRRFAFLCTPYFAWKLGNTSVYPEQGDPESGIEPGTAFEDIPDDWTCPLCGVGKEDFEPYEG